MDVDVLPDSFHPEAEITSAKGRLFFTEPE